MNAAPVHVAEPGAATSTAMSFTHREHLDGLRTIAVYLVVLFHAGLAQFVGGFIGVDTFFVLSGFLVGSVVFTEHQRTGRIGLRRFYARRVRRLLPAAVVTVVGTAAASVLVLPRLARVGFVADAKSALLYFANWHFLHDATDYFASDVQKSPYLHFWSLAIEEQFYIVFPVLLVGLLALARRIRRVDVVSAGLMAGLVASVMRQVMLAPNDPLRAYYATDARLYQLFAGAVLAWEFHRWRRDAQEDGQHRPDSARTAGVVAVVALIALVLVGTDVVHFGPSGRGLAATASAMALIAALELAPRSLVGRVLSTSPMTYLGRISYGTYLWHWPILILCEPVLRLGPGQRAVVAAVGATAIAALSAQMLEVPIRTAPLLARRPVIVVAVGLSLSILASFTLVPHLLRSTAKPALPSRLGSTVDASAAQADPAVVAALLAATPPAVLDMEPTKPPDVDLSACSAENPQGCILHQGSGFHVHLVGDSNAQMLISTFLQLATKYDFTFSVTAASGCPWQEGLVWNTEKNPGLVQACVEHRPDWYADIIPALHPDLVVIAGVPRDPGSRPDATYEPEDGPLGSRSLNDVITRSTHDTLVRITGTGARVAILEPLPYGMFEPAQCLSGAAKVGDCAWTVAPTPYPTETIERQQTQVVDGVYTIDWDHVACPYLPVCIPLIDGEIVFRNEFHLSDKWMRDHAEDIWALIMNSGAADG